MATYNEMYTVASTDSTLLRQTAYAIKKAAFDITNESAGTANHAVRLQWSRNVTLTHNAPLEWARKMIWRVLDNATIQASITTTNGVVTSSCTDSDVQFVVNGLIDEFALG